MKHSLLLFLSLLFQFDLVAQDIQDSKEVQFDDGSPNILITYFSEVEHKDVEFKASPVKSITAKSGEWLSRRAAIKENRAECRLHSNIPILLSIIPSNDKFKIRTLLIEPGDSISIVYHNGRLVFNGKGSEKLRLQIGIDSIKTGIPRPSNHKDYITTSLQDYFEWCDYLNKQLELVMPFMASYKPYISSYAFNLIRAIFLDQNIDDRSDKFASLIWIYGRQAGMHKESICAIYDTTYYPVVEKYFPVGAEHVFGTLKPIVFQVDRQFLFDYKNEPLNNSFKKKLLYYTKGTHFYKGQIRELFIQDQLGEFIKKFGFTSEVEHLLSDYYKEAGFPLYKQWLKAYELQRRDVLNEKSPVDFTFTDVYGNSFTKNQLEGRITVFDFWFTGCAGCLDMAPALERVKEQFKGDTNVIFVDVSVDKDRTKWLKSIKQGNYTSESSIHLYTGGQGTDHEMLKRYGIEGFPSILVMSPWGSAVRAFSQLDPRINDGKEFIAALKLQKNAFKDGPYLFNEGRALRAYFIDCSVVSSKDIIDRKRGFFPVTMDEGIDLKVTLKDELKIEPSVFGKVEKLLVMSDIEGNLRAFTKLLQANKVIDDKYNWTFGNGHLVLNGDMFDRGEQVSECLWLIYYLEEKAKKEGGYVHFVLGNHEIMNLQGDTKYVKPKYIYNAGLLGKDTKDLYAQNSELGEWLRTKNIMEKIGDLLFVHGGVSKEFADSVPLPIKEINNLFRQNIDVNRTSNRYTEFIFSKFYSPFWFRLYYEDKDEQLVNVNDPKIKLVVHHPSEEQLDRIMDRWDVNKIVTGHTIVADTISAHYNGKVINTDTNHAKGKSEALLIEGRNYFRVDHNGKKYLLLKEFGRVVNTDFGE